VGVAELQKFVTKLIWLYEKCGGTDSFQWSYSFGNVDDLFLLFTWFLRENGEKSALTIPTHCTNIIGTASIRNWGCYKILNTEQTPLSEKYLVCLYGLWLITETLQFLDRSWNHRKTFATTKI